jgi:hypothetical protein
MPLLLYHGNPASFFSRAEEVLCLPGPEPSTESAGEGDGGALQGDRQGIDVGCW